MDTSLILWLEENTALAIPLLIFFAFAEACFGIGLFTSGVILLGVATVIAANELATPIEIVIFAWLGAWEHQFVQLGMEAHFDAMSQGRLDSRDVVYFVTWMAMSVLVARFVLALRRGRVM